MLAINFNLLQQAAPAEQSQSFPINRLPEDVMNRIAFFIGSENWSWAAPAFKSLSSACIQVINSEFKPYIMTILGKLNDAASANQKASLHEILSKMNLDFEVYPRNPESIKLKVFNALKTLTRDEFNAIGGISVSEDVIFILEMVNSISMINEHLVGNAEWSDSDMAIVNNDVKIIIDLEYKKEIHLAICYTCSIADGSYKASSLSNIACFLTDQRDFERAMKVANLIEGEEKEMSIRAKAIAEVKMKALSHRINEKVVRNENMLLAIDAVCREGVDETELTDALRDMAIKLAIRGSSEEQIRQVAENIPNEQVRSEILQDVAKFRHRFFWE